MEDLGYIRDHIDELLIITNGNYEDHMAKLSSVLTRLHDASLKVNIKKSFFPQEQLEYLGYWITREGIQPVANKVHAITKLQLPKPKRSYVDSLACCTL